MEFLKDKFYPVDMDRLVILNTPKASKEECSFPDGSSTFSGYIGVKGQRLNAVLAAEEFTVVEA